MRSGCRRRRLWLRLWLRREGSDRRSRQRRLDGMAADRSSSVLLPSLLLKLLLRETLGLFFEPLSLLALVPPV